MFWRSGLSVHVGIVAKTGMRVVVEDLDRFNFFQQALINCLDISRRQMRAIAPTREVRPTAARIVMRTQRTCLRFIVGPSCRAVDR